MASDIVLHLDERMIDKDGILLESVEYDNIPIEDMELYQRNRDDSNLMIEVHRYTGKPLLITLWDFRTETKHAVEILRKHPLPWVFTLESMGIKEKPLEDVLLAIWKKYRKG